MNNFKSLKIQIEPQFIWTSIDSNVSAKKAAKSESKKLGRSLLKQEPMNGLNQMRNVIKSQLINRVNWLTGSFAKSESSFVWENIVIVTF